MNFRCNVWLSFFVCTAIITNVGATQAFAQTRAPAQDVAPAVIAFEISPAELLESEFAKAMGLEKDLKRGPAVPKMLANAKSIRGVVSLPKLFDSIVQPPVGETSPVDFYIEAKITDEELLAQVEQELAEVSETYEEKGVIFYTPQGESNMYLVFGEDQTFTLATNNYTYGAKNLDRLSAQAKKLFAKDSKAAARVVVDVDGARAFVDSAVEFGEENLPPAARSFLLMPQQLKWVQATSDLKDDTLLKVVAECTSNEDAMAVSDSIRALIGAGKMTLGREAMSVMMGQMLDSIKPKVDGKTLSFTVAQPKGLTGAMAEAANEAKIFNNHRQMSLATHNYADSYGEFPFLPREGDSDKLSWRVRVLPFIDSGDLSQSFAMNEPWDSETNKRLLEFMPAAYGEGEKTGICWVKGSVTRFEDITDGTSNTIAFVENPNKVNWTEAEDLTPDQALKIFLNLKEGEKLLVTMYDGSVQQLGSETSGETFRAMLTPNGGEVIER